mgnify:FL=1
MRKLLLTISFMLACTAIHAVPAKRGIWRTLSLADGKQVKAELRGDEYMSYYQTATGECYMLNSGTGFYEQVNVDAMQEISTAKRAMQNARRMQRVESRRAKAAARVAGTKKGLVVLVEFSDTYFSSSDAQLLYNDILNGENYKNSELGFVGSVRDYFRDQSNGQLLIDFDVVGPVRLSKNYAYYGENTGIGGQDAHPDEMVASACEAVADQVDFNDYDWDGDGVADQVCILYAGRGEASGGGANSIWPHESALTRYGRNVVIDGVKVDTYACSCELGEKGTIDGIGTFCHEFSHCLGIPDVYDTGSLGNYGMYRWDIMSYGNYNGGSFVPSAYTSYERWLAGWLEPVELTEDTDISDMKALEDGGHAYIIYNDGNRNEYYLLENRQKTGWDAAQPGDGLLIIHVDYDATVWKNNTVNTQRDHQRLTPIAADNSYEAYDDDCAGDAFPYNGNNSLTKETVPAAVLFNKNTDGSYNMNKSVTDITENADGTISFSFRIDNDKPQPDAAGNWFYESFDQCNSKGGNDGDWRNRGTGGTAEEFVGDNKGWTLTSYNAPAYKCMKTSAQSITAPMMYFDNGSEFVFKAAPCNGDKKELTLTADGATLSQSSFTLVNGEWTECRAKLTGEGYVSLKFSTGGAFFIDELRMICADVVSSIDGIIVGNNPTGDNSVYGIDGRYLGTDINALGKGLYIVGGKKVVK